MNENNQMNILEFWSKVIKFVDNNDLEGFKNHFSIDYSCVDESKYITAIMFVDDNPDFLQYLIFNGGVNRADINPDEITPNCDKMFTTKELSIEMTANIKKMNKSNKI